jgi:hypothetical protein
MNLTDEQKAHVLEIVQAVMESKNIECLSFESGQGTKTTTAIWVISAIPNLSHLMLLPDHYRIKPEPTYKPYTKVDRRMLGHIIMHKSGEAVQVIQRLNFRANQVNGKKLQELFDYWQYDNLEPFGELSE